VLLSSVLNSGSGLQEDAQFKPPPERIALGYGLSRALPESHALRQAMKPIS